MEKALGRKSLPLYYTSPVYQFSSGFPVISDFSDISASRFYSFPPIYTKNAAGGIPPAARRGDLVLHILCPDLVEPHTAAGLVSIFA